MAAEPFEAHDPGGPGERPEDPPGSLAESLAHHVRGLVAAAGPLPQSPGDAVRVVTDALRRAADDFGLILPDFPPSGRRFDTGGQEHDVWFELQADPQYVFKATKPNAWGLVPGQLRRSHPLDYLDRIWLANRVLGFPWDLYGVWVDELGRPRIVTTQFFMPGDPATEEQIAADLTARGFILHDHPDCGPLWIHPQLRVAIGDAYPDNFVVLSDGTLMPIDVAIAPYLE